MRYLLLFFFVLIGSLCAYAQERDSIRLDSVAADTVLQDSIKLAQDTVKKESRKERRARERAEAEREKYYYKGIKKDSARLEIERLSRVAWKRSLIVPGWGQYTNQGLWWIKVPIIYGGLVTGYVVFDYWQWYYKKFLDEIAFRLEYGDTPNDPDLINWGNEGLVRQKDYARRNRDLTILVSVGWWGLNVIEAYVDSMLKNRWDIGRDMSMRIRPALMPTYAHGGYGLSGYGVAPGIKLTLNLK
ncbi:hypothetical protein BC792_1427 [Sphingobacterium allocomposti]|uniref:DUF5683 domain-containing protein n=1 Tax=Sphingobacterium allocomposti TaxID=415956 RepID=A0A5S5CVX1_9SPHI|nr:DUF5683 domain-containing protein [Sphingobacterium composti Yoo et al. 2007 non Ten et al. 2007]TYP86966.1 hypothetical protein BC792_1427 [Sphingobacterium composti Yoo et al. 2007 non Ten et al. 2007]